jgi:UPF0755 protein
VESS